jgi:uncharacterized phage infection (PIP) family protein YhgE
MKSGELNSAECYEQSQCAAAENQQLADKLDAMDLIVFQISNALRAARIRVQKEDRKMSPGWIDLDNTENRLKDLLEDVRIIGNDIKKQADFSGLRVDPTEYVRNS